MGYGIAYFKSPQIKSEFKRFGLEKAGALTAVLELLGAVESAGRFKVSFYFIDLCGRRGHINVFRCCNQDKS
jgi:hypothetical protein